MGLYQLPIPWIHEVLSPGVKAAGTWIWPRTSI